MGTSPFFTVDDLLSLSRRYHHGSGRGDERSGRNRRRACLLPAARAVGICAVLCFRHNRLPCAGSVWSIVAAGRARAGQFP